MDNKTIVDLSLYKDNFSKKDKLIRLLWVLSWNVLVRPFNIPVCRNWRNVVFRLFGAKIHRTCNIYASAKVWAPWNLEMAAYSTLGPLVDCYNQGRISIGANTTISQKSYLCASTHDITNSTIPLILKPIVIADQVWIAADAFIGPGVTIGEGAVIGARSAVFKDIEPWSIVGGNPAKFIKKREITS